MAPFLAVATSTFFSTSTRSLRSHLALPSSQKRCIPTLRKRRGAKPIHAYYSRRRFGRSQAPHNRDRLYRGIFATSEGTRQQRGDVLIGTILLAAIYTFALGEPTEPDAYFVAYNEAVSYTISSMAVASGIHCA
ncbi:hypothetical protein LTS12_028041 [Elasticomyces elasticus]|nr:hypothetical protein LTS12_028041 [Elasticomyces elasticus]